MPLHSDASAERRAVLRMPVGVAVLALLVSVGCADAPTATPSEQVTETPAGPTMVFLARDTAATDVDVFASAAFGATAGTNVTRAPGPYRSLSVSPNGRRLLVTTIRRPGERRAALAMDLDGANLTPISTPEQYAWAPRWSPNGNQVAYTVCCCAGCQVWVARADGSERWVVSPPRPDTTVREENWAHGWTPDGALVYHKYGGNTLPSTAFTVPATGGAATLLFGQPYLQSPSWSPDGKRVAFIRTDVETRKNTLVVANADGSSPAVLVDDIPGVRLDIPALGLPNPGQWWSPDGQWLAFWDASSAIYVLRADGSERRLLSAGDTVYLFAGWSPDGRVTYEAVVEGQPTVIVIAPDGSRREVLPLGTKFRSNFLWLAALR